MKNGNPIQSRRASGLTIVALAGLGVLLASCDLPDNGQSESHTTPATAHAGKESAAKNGVFDSFIRGVGSAAGRVGKTILEHLHLRTSDGEWPQSYSDIAAREVDKHPALINGLPGRANPLKGICDNFLTFDLKERKSVLVRLAASLSAAESRFNNGGKGDEGRGPTEALGIMQISSNARNFGCFHHGGPRDPAASIECAYMIMDSQYQNHGLPVANPKSHWGVLRPDSHSHFAGTRVDHPMERKFMPSFTLLVPECAKSIVMEKGRGYEPPPQIVSQPVDSSPSQATALQLNSTGGAQDRI